MTVAQLGLAVDSSQVDRAIPSLDKLTASTKAADAAADGLAAGARSAGAAVGQLTATTEAEALAQGRATATSRAHAMALQAEAQAARLVTAQRTNLIFQLQDIGVSLASGMNPLMVAIQQGSQMSTIYGPGGLGKALSETAKMAGSAVTRFAPLALAIGAVTASVAALTTEINRGQKVQVSFFDVMQAGWELAAERIVQTFSPVVDWLGGIWDWLSPRLADGLINLIRNFDLAFKDIKTIWSMLPAALGDATIKTANAVIDGLEKMINQSIDLLNDTLIRPVQESLKAIGIDIGLVPKVDFNGGIPNPLAGSEGALQKQLGQNRLDVMNTDYGGMIADRAREIAGRLSPEELKKLQKEAERMAEAYRDITRSAEQRIAQAELEVQVLGKTREEADRLRITQELLNKAANENIKLTPKQVAELKGLAGAIAAAEENTRRLTEICDLGKQITGSFFSDLKSGLKDGESAWQALGNAAANALDSIANKALEMAANGIWDMIFGAVMGGLTGGGGLTPKPVTNIGFGAYGSFDTGGWTGGSAGQPAGVVHGQEFVVKAGPAARFRPMLEAMNNNQPMASNSNGSVTLQVNVVGARGDTEIREMARAGAQEALNAYDRHHLPGRVKQINKDPYAVG